MTAGVWLRITRAGGAGTREFPPRLWQIAINGRESRAVKWATLVRKRTARRVGGKFNEALGPRQQAAGPTNVQQPAMALTMSAPVHVDSGRATVHWHNAHGVNGAQIR